MARSDSKRQPARRTSPSAKVASKRSRKKAAGHRKRATAGATSAKKWSQRVTQTSDALDLDDGVFKRDAASIARSLKRSAERSRRRKATPYGAAMSMLTFYANRAGRNLSPAARAKLERAKLELRRLFGRD